MSNKWKNLGLWISLFSLLGMILIDAKIIPDLIRFKQYTDILLPTLIAAGVISNPSKGNSYIDKEDK